MALSSLANVADVESEQSNPSYLRKRHLRSQGAWMTSIIVKRTLLKCLYYSGIGRFSDALGFAQRCTDLVKITARTPTDVAQFRRKDSGAGRSRVVRRRRRLSAGGFAPGHHRAPIHRSFTCHIYSQNAGRVVGHTDEGLRLAGQGYKAAESWRTNMREPLFLPILI